MIKTRLLFDIIVALSLFIAPWWLSVILALFGLFYFSFFIEFIMVGFIFDSLFGVRLQSFFNFYFIYTTAFGLFFILVESLKNRLRD